MNTCNYVTHFRCTRFVSNNLSTYKDGGQLEHLPTLIKNNLILKITRIYKGFQDEDLLQNLLNSSLTKIDLFQSFVTDKTLINLSTISKQLRILKLPQFKNDEIDQISLDCLLECLKKMSALEAIHIRYSRIVNDEVIECLCTYCPNIRILDVEGCHKITDNSIKFIRSLKISQLNLAHTQISDEGISELSNSNCSSVLEDLNVSYSNVTGDALAHLKWDKLKYIFFDGCKIEGEFSEGKSEYIDYYNELILL